MPEIHVLISFVLAALVMQTLPGPDMLVVITRSVTQGKRIALYSVCGIAAAGLIQIPFLAFGIGAIFQTSLIAYLTLKYAGAVYLIYIGVKFIFQTKIQKSTKSNVNSKAPAFFQGFWSNLLNPKVLVFLLAFLPQFVDSNSSSITVQFIILGIIMKSSGFIVMSTIAIMSDTLSRLLLPKSILYQWQEKIVGSIFIILGLNLFFSEQNASN